MLSNLFTPVNLTIASLTVVALLYIASAIGYSMSSRPGMMIAFFGYVVANIGLIWDAIQVSAK